MRYKLLKDLPWLDAGNILEEHKSEVMEYKCDWINVNKLNEALCYIIHKSIWNPEWFEEIKEVKSIYNLKDWDIYFYINEVYRLCDCGFNKIESQHDLFFWNAFLTKEEAETELQKRKAMATIKKWSYNNDWGYEFGNNWFNYYVSLDTDTQVLYVYQNCSIKDYSCIYYSKKEIAEQALKELEAEYKIVFNMN
jgi:hypothetical protein